MTKNKGNIALIYLVAFGGGAYLFISAYLFTNDYIQLLTSKSIEAKGVVSSVEYIGRGKNYITIEYQDLSGSTYNYKSDFSYRFFAPDRGDSLSILYLKSDPNLAVINNFRGKILKPLWRYLLGILLITIGIYVMKSSVGS